MLTETQLELFPQLLNPAIRNEFVITVEVRMGNPNGDPDNNGAPRVLPSGEGSISDVRMKRWLRDWLEQKYGPDALYIARDAAEKKQCLKDRAKVYSDLESLIAGYRDVRLLGGLILADGSKKDRDKAKKDKKAKKAQEAPVVSDTPENGENDEEEEDKTAGNTAVLGPWQLGHGISAGVLDFYEEKITRIMSETGKDAQNNSKDRDFGLKYIVPRATYKMGGRYSSHLGLKRKLTAGDMVDFWQGVVNGPSLRPSASSGHIWVSNLKVWTYENDVPTMHNIHFDAPPSLVDIGIA